VKLSLREKLIDANKVNSLHFKGSQSHDHHQLDDKGFSQLDCP
jgi:hypothetical protein